MCLQRTINFFCNDEIYEYELSKDRNKVNVMSQEDKKQKVVTYKLENNYIRIGKAPAGRQQYVYKNTNFIASILLHNIFNKICEKF